MINSLVVRNVRSFLDKETHFDLPQLTVLCGTNNSGKSSVLKSILLLRQSQGINEQAQQRNGFLRFVGSQVDMGEYSTFVNNRDTSKDITISLKVPSTIKRSEAIFLRSLCMQMKKSDKDSRDLSRSPLSPYSIDVCFVFRGVKIQGDITEQTSPEDTIEEGKILSQIQGLLKEAKFTLMASDGMLLSWKVLLSSGKSIGGRDAKYHIVFSKKYFDEIGGDKLMEPIDTSEKSDVKLNVTLDGLIPSRLRVHEKRIRKSDEDETKYRRWVFFPLPPHIEDAIKDLKRAMQNIHYVAPLRAPAKRFYITNFDFLPNLDPAGEFIPYLLAKDQERKVKHILPDKNILVTEGLSSALNKWMHYLRTGKSTSSQQGKKEYRVSSLKRTLVELEILNPQGDKLYSLADSGFGYSQILPIIIRGLLAEKSSTLMIEQPELHLNPALQVRLAEFFICLVLAGKQIILETHSEHIVNSIRVLIAEKLDSDLAAKAKIYFLACTPNGPAMHELSVREDGTVPDWPMEFFGEAATLTGRLLRAQKQKRLENHYKEVK